MLFVYVFVRDRVAVLKYKPFDITPYTYFSTYFGSRFRLAAFEVFLLRFGTRTRFTGLELDFTTYTHVERRERENGASMNQTKK